MAKTLDSLQTLSRVLLLLAATVIATAVSYHPPFRYSRVLEGLTRLNRLYDELTGDIGANATLVYRAQLAPAFAKAPSAEADALKAMESVPEVLTASANGKTIPIPLTSPDLTMLELNGYANSNWPAVSYTVLTLDPAQFAKFVDDAQNMPAWNGLIVAKDLMVEVGEPDPKTRLCDLVFRSESWEQQRRSSLVTRIGCSAAATQDVTPFWFNFYVRAQKQLGLLSGGVQIPQDIALLPRSIARDKLATLATSETAEETGDVLGAKLGIAGVLNIGPIVIIVILAMMLGQARWARTLSDKDPAESAFWFSQFLGWSSFGFVAALWALPFVAAGMATDVTYVEPQELLSKPWYDPALIHSQRWFIAALAISFVLSTWLAIENWRAARAWRKRLEAAAARPDDTKDEPTVVILSSQELAVEAPAPIVQEDPPAKASQPRAKRQRSAG
ncbi:hypothetical protein FJW05_11180 [Mesorhizobium sp. B2-9-1]|uniref:hypothetical protein n=1 Tax=Mesorhizobium sp. B2-9-1 TaxID=2589898 RepID=UPI001127C033|nr:hypothetical protein [Mesorhizobium sp. B2-9-1]TPI47530.1 hypothetical protein FJW05_11180 [Mesorhizobium sp. B2-9-1]